MLSWILKNSKKKINEKWIFFQGKKHFSQPDDWC